MSILRDAGGFWPYRYPVSFWTSTNAGAKDGVFTVQPSFGGFWEKLDAPGYELRVTNETGDMLLAYNRSAYTYATRSITIQVNDIPVAAGTTKLIWLYWGQDGAADGDTDPTITAPISGVVTNLLPTAPMVSFRPERPASTVPAQSVTKSIAEVQDVWWNLSGLLSRAASPDGGYTEAEEVDAVSFAVFDADSSQAGMFEANQTAFAELKGVLYVRTRWKAGSAAGIYTLRLTVTTTTGRTAETRVVGYVTDLQE